MKLRNSIDQHPQPLVTWDQVAAFRLSRHHLLERAPAKSLATVAGDMGGAQAQLLSAAQVSLGIRARGMRLAEVEEAIDKRKLVKAACMRRTLFLVPSDELAVFVRGSARRAEKEINWARKKGIPDRVLDATIDATLSALDQPLTRTEIAERVSKALGVQTQNIHGGGWGSRRKVAAVSVGDLTYPVVYLLHLAAARGVFCYGPYRGNEPTFVRADAWIPRWKDVSREEAESLLLRKYLRAFGPASVADFALWAGVSQTETREIWSREQADIVSVDVQGWAANILRGDLAELGQASFEHPSVRLLPYFDTFLLGHKDRRHLVDAKRHPQIYRPQGWISPVLLVDGRVAGVWEQGLKGDRLQIKVTKFGKMSRQAVDGVREEAQDLGRFFGISDVKVKISQ